MEEINLELNNLAVKYRPKTLQECFLPPNIYNHFMDVFEGHRPINNAYIFYGQSGGGKTTLCRIIADSMNYNYIELDAASNSGVADVRNVVNTAEYTAIGYEKTLIVFDEAHRLSASAWDVLLKTLECPRSTIFIFCTTEPTKIKETIRSRCLSFRFPKVEACNIVKRVKEIAKKEKINLSHDDIASISSDCDGNLRDAINRISLPIGSKEDEVNKTDLIEYVKENNFKGLRLLVYGCKDCKTLVYTTIDTYLEGKGSRGEGYNPNNKLDIFIKGLMKLILNADHENFKLLLLTHCYISMG